MSKRFVWLCTVVGAVLLRVSVAAQEIPTQLPEANRSADGLVPPVVASMHAAQSPQSPGALPPALKQEQPDGEAASQIPSPLEPEGSGPPRLPPCPDRFFSFQEEVAVQLCHQIRSDPPSTELIVDGQRLRKPEALLAFYARRGYLPAWMDVAGKPQPTTETLLHALGEAEREGLRSWEGQRTVLRRRLAAVSQGGSPDAEQWAQLDVWLTDAFLAYSSALLSGQLTPHQADPDWAIRPRSRDLVALLEEALAKNQIAETLRALTPQSKGYIELRKMLHQYRKIAQAGGWPTVTGMGKTLQARLEASGDWGLGNSGGKSEKSHIAEALRRFQRRHGLPETGKLNAETLAALNVPVTERIRQIELNMERWRWMPEDLGARYILVNIPNYKVQVIEDGRVVMEAKAVVGREERQTPAFTATMEYLVLSPKWYVPRNIAVKDKLPQLRRDPYALARQGIRIYNGAGQQIDPGSVNWSAVSARNFNYQLRQDAGPRNALGGVKFMFPNPYSIYLHDTPSRELFSRNQRTYSSGCIRISNPLELAEYLLRYDPKWDRDRIKAAAVSGRQQVVSLPAAVRLPVYLLYWTAWVDAEGTLHFREDVYKRDERLAKALYQDGRQQEGKVVTRHGGSG